MKDLSNKGEELLCSDLVFFFAMLLANNLKVACRQYNKKKA